MSDDDSPRVSRRTVLRTTGAAGAGLALGTGHATAAPTVGACESTDRTEPPQPGHPILYEDPHIPPQFETDTTWEAAPLLVSGAQAYDHGEFLYQDWVFDDYGANTDEADTDPQPPTSTSLSNPVGDIVYPTDDDRYRDNAADLVEFRCRTHGNRLVYRLTLNTLVDRSVPAIAIGIDTGEATETTWGHGLGNLGAPVDHVLVVTGTQALLDGSSGPVQDLSVDERRNQIEVTVDLQPGDATWTHYCVTGLHDGDGGFAAVLDQPDEDNPGGAKGSSPPPVFNVAFREEPISAWRETAQANALADRDISAFGAEIDFAKLRRHVTLRQQADPDTRTGYINRLYGSRISIDGQTSYAADEEGVEDDGDDAVLTGHVQPYSVYVPESYDPENPGPLHVLPHSLGQNYNQYSGNPNLLRQLGEQRDALILMFEGRGPAGWWHDEAEFDLFEAWGDFCARYMYDPDQVTIGGYSMGGYATYRLASLYPDLFAAGFEIVGPPDEDIAGGPTDGTVESVHNTLDITDNMRHIPLLMWHGSNDELVPLPGPMNYHQDLQEHGYRHEFDVFPGYDHFLFSVLDEWGPGRDFLEGTTVTRSPDRVTYRSKPAMGHEVPHSGFELTYDSAYWVSDITVAAPESDAGGLVDVISHADGYGEPVAETFSSLGTEPNPHIKRGTEWAEPILKSLPRNALDIDATGVSAVTIWVDEAGLDPSEDIELTVSTDTPVTVRLAADNHVRPVEVPPGDHTITVSMC